VEIDGVAAYECRYCYGEDSIETSSQVDIIIYDALRFGPIVRLEACDVFPLEAVCAYVEVKSLIDNKRDSRTKLTPLEAILLQSGRLRSRNVRLYHASVPGMYTGTLLVPFPYRETVPIRSFVFALEGDRSLGTPTDILELLEQARATHGGFLSGMYIQGKGYFQSVHLEPNAPTPSRFFETDSSPSALARFKNQLYSGLSRFPRPLDRWTPAIDRYYTNEPVPCAVVQLL
jgi:hypothetical protein